MVARRYARPWQPDAVNVLSDKLVFRPRLAAGRGSMQWTGDFDLAVFAALTPQMEAELLASIIADEADKLRSRLDKRRTRSSPAGRERISGRRVA